MSTPASRTYFPWVLKSIPDPPSSPYVPPSSPRRSPSVVPQPSPPADSSSLFSASFPDSAQQTPLISFTCSLLDVNGVLPNCTAFLTPRRLCVVPSSARPFSIDLSQIHSWLPAVKTGLAPPKLVSVSPSGEPPADALRLYAKDRKVHMVFDVCAGCPFGELAQRVDATWREASGVERGIMEDVREWKEGSLERSFEELGVGRTLEMLEGAFGDWKRFLERARQDVGQRVCGKVFVTGDQVYLCNSCGLGPGSCLCSACFEAGSHVGHAYRAVTARSDGGCCDCGDPSAVKMSGFCPEHRGCELGADPSLKLGEDTRKKLTSAFGPCWGKLVSCCEAKDEDSVWKLAEWMRQVCVDGGDGVQHLLGQSLLSADGLAKRLLLAWNTLNTGARKSLSLAILKLFGDGLFKRGFAKVLFANYLPIFSVVLPEAATADNVYSDRDSVQTLTCQIREAKDLVHDLLMSQEIALPAGLVGVLAKYYSQAVDPETGVVTPAKLSRAREIWWDAGIDWKEFLHHDEGAQLVLKHHLQAVNSWGDVLRALTGSAFLPRLNTTSMGDWGVQDQSACVASEMQLLHQLKFLCSAVSKCPDSAVALSCSRMAAEWCAQWAPGCGVSASLLSGDNISVHLTVMRAAARLAVAAMQSSDSLTLQEILGQANASADSSFCSAMLEAPVWLQAWHSHVHSTPNDGKLPRYADLYKDRLGHETFEGDVVAMQIASCIAGPERWTELVFDHFGWAQVTPDSITKAEQPQLKMLEDAAVLLLHVSGDRTHRMTLVQSLRRALVHFLCLADTQHSSLMENGVKDSEDHEEAEKIIPEISVAGRSGARPVLKIKPECWAEYDPYYIRLSTEARDVIAEPRHWAHLSSSSLSEQRPANPVSPHPALSGLTSILGEPKVVTLVSSVMAAHATAGTIPGSLLRRCLDIADRAVGLGHGQAYKPILQDLLKVSSSSLKGAPLAIAKRIAFALSALAAGVDDDDGSAGAPAAALPPGGLESIFADTARTSPAPLDSPSGAALKSPALEVQPGEAVCVCCKKPVEPHGKPYGLLSFAQRSRLLGRWQEICMGREHVQKWLPPQQLRAAAQPPAKKQPTPLLASLPRDAVSALFGAAPTAEGVHICSCGHYAHEQCVSELLEGLVSGKRKRKVERMRRRTGQPQRRDDDDDEEEESENTRLGDPEKNEFQCPVCRRFGNLLAPVSAASEEKTMSVARKVWAVRKSCSLQQALTADPAVLAAALSAAVAYTLSCSELSLRSGGIVLAPWQQVHLRTLCSAASHALSLCKASVREAIVELSGANSTPTSVAEEAVLPVLSRDPFSSLFNHLMAIPDGARTSQETFRTLARRALSICMVQSQICLSASQRAATSSLSERLVQLASVISPFLVPSAVVADTATTTTTTTTQSGEMVVLETSLLPFLRRLFLLDSLMRNDAQISTIPASPDALCHPLGLESLSDTAAQVTAESVGSWLASVVEIGVEPVLCEVGAVPFSLVPLHKEFSFMRSSTKGAVCMVCGATPKAVAICLFCGGYICGTPAGHKQNELHEHASTCCCTGAFLFTELSAVMVVRPKQAGGPWLEFIYLTAHGEEDMSLRSGVPLYLSEERFAKLTRALLTHSVDSLSNLSGFLG